MRAFCVAVGIVVSDGSEFSRGQDLICHPEETYDGMGFLEERIDGLEVEGFPLYERCFSRFVSTSTLHFLPQHKWPCVSNVLGQHHGSSTAWTKGQVQAGHSWTYE